MNLLDLVPSFKRHLRKYNASNDVDSMLAAYLADGIEALMTRWTRDYAITATEPLTFEVAPDVEAKDKRPIILMASIIYKMGNGGLDSFRDGDFSWDPAQGRSTNTLALDAAELDKILGPSIRLAQGFTAPLRGFSSIYNRETYDPWTIWNL